MVSSRLAVAAALFQLASVAAGHGDDEHSSMGMDIGDMNSGTAPPHKTNPFAYLYDMPSYAGLSAHRGLILAHVGLMVVAWVFVLPLGVMFSVGRSRFALLTQFLFLILNGLGIISGTIYNVKTPDLYENNAHHKIGWIATWIMAAQVVMGLIFVYSGRYKKARVSSSENTAFLPVSVETMAQHNMRPYSDYRWSDDSGQGTERSSVQTSRDASPTDPSRRDEYQRYPKPELEAEDDDDEHDNDIPQRRRFLPNTFVDKYLSNWIPGMLSEKPLKMLEFIYGAIDRTIIILGFIALTSGGVTWAGIFRSDNIFNGLAHFVKGGIFFWYGLLTLGRWMGCFAEFGWGWNIKPSRSQVGQWQSSLPSAEFVESFVIWLYGTINVFLEHLAAWGGAWVAQDLEHVSISIMFFGGGLCGMLVESKKIREWLNTSIDIVPEKNKLSPLEEKDLRTPPKTYSIPMNPIPALIILLLGIMMSSHHQDSMVSTKVHGQWGTLLCGFSLARCITYIITYISPPTSIFPSRPPTELISSFCLISGGLVFMASTKDIIYIMEANNLMAMFLFTVMMGFTAFLMAWTIIVLALKGWAVRRELRAAPAVWY